MALGELADIAIMLAGCGVSILALDWLERNLPDALGYGTAHGNGGIPSIGADDPETQTTHSQLTFSTRLLSGGEVGL